MRTSILIACVCIVLGHMDAWAAERQVNSWGEFRAGMSENDLTALFGPSRNPTSAATRNEESRELSYPGRVKIEDDLYNLNVLLYRNKAYKFQFSSSTPFKGVAQCVLAGEAIADGFTALYGKQDSGQSDLQAKKITAAWIGPDGSGVALLTTFSENSCNHAINFKFPNLRKPILPIVISPGRN